MKFWLGTNARTWIRTYRTAQRHVTSWLALNHWNGAWSAVSIAARGCQTKAAAPRLLSLSSLSVQKMVSNHKEREREWRRNDSNSTKNLVIAFASHFFLLPLPPFAPSLCLSISPPKLSSFCSQTLNFIFLSLSLSNPNFLSMCFYVVGVWTLAYIWCDALSISLLSNVFSLFVSWAWESVWLPRNGRETTEITISCLVSSLYFFFTFQKKKIWKFEIWKLGLSFAWKLRNQKSSVGAARPGTTFIFSFFYNKISRFGFT